MLRRGPAKPPESWFLASRTFALAAVILPLWAIAPCQASPTTAPKRLVNGYAVDLTPLFRWWTNHQGARPLAAWVHVTGNITATNTLGWVVSGRADRSNLHGADPEIETPSLPAAHQFILKNPPAQEAAEFQRLRAQLQQLTAQRTQLQQDAANAKHQAAQVQKSSHRRNRNRVAAHDHQIAQADNNAVKNLDQQISDLHKKLAAYPEPDHFAIDALALDTGTQYNQLPIFDHGLSQP